MLDYTPEQIADYLICETPAGPALKPRETVEFMSKMIEMLNFLKEKLPTDDPTGPAFDAVSEAMSHLSRPAASYDAARTITVWEKKKITIPEYKSLLAEVDFVAIFPDESEGALNIANEMSRELKKNIKVVFFR